MVSKLLNTAMPDAHVHLDTFSLCVSFYWCDICHLQMTSQSSLSSSFRTESWFCLRQQFRWKAYLDLFKTVKDYNSKLSSLVVLGNDSRDSAFSCLLHLHCRPLLLSRFLVSCGKASRFVCVCDWLCTALTCSQMQSQGTEWRCPHLPLKTPIWCSPSERWEVHKKEKMRVERASPGSPYLLWDGHSLCSLISIS